MAVQLKLTGKAIKYFDRMAQSSLTGSITTDMEKWWLCSQIGLLYDKKSKVENAPDMGVRFVKSLKEHSTKIRGILLWRQLKRHDIIESEIDQFEKELASTFGEGELKITNKGGQALDEFAAGGFEIIKEDTPNPKDLLIFLYEYNELIKRAPNE